MRFLGTYTLKAENGNVKFPWEISAEEKFIWIITETRERSVVTTCCTIIDSRELEAQIPDENMPPEEFTLTAKGEFVLKAGGIWEIPEAIQNHLKSDTVNFLGVGDFIEILTTDTMDNYNDVIKNIEDELSW